MPKQENEQVVETAIEARGAERGPTVRNVLVWSLGLVVAAFAVIYFVFFRTWSIQIGILSVGGMPTLGITADLFSAGTSIFGDGRFFRYRLDAEEMITRMPSTIDYASLGRLSRWKWPSSRDCGKTALPKLCATPDLWW
jgi:hypothetical protein